MLYYADAAIAATLMLLIRARLSNILPLLITLLTMSCRADDAAAAAFHAGRHYYAIAFISP